VQLRHARNSSGNGAQTPTSRSAAMTSASTAALTAAMMLPGAAPAVLRHAHASGRPRAVPLFVGSYLAVWTLVSGAVYALYRPEP
jgi:predicted metal-binding membrane protein